MSYTLEISELSKCYDAFQGGHDNKGSVENDLCFSMLDKSATYSTCLGQKCLQRRAWRPIFILLIASSQSRSVIARLHYRLLPTRHI